MEPAVWGAPTGPASLVVLDEIDAYTAEIEAMVSSPPARCTAGPIEGPVSEDALRVCGEVLAELAGIGDLRAELTAAVERHELQHRIDGPRLARAIVVERRMALQDPDVLRRANRELSAYLAELTAPGRAPRTTLVRLLRFVAKGRARPEFTVALLAFEALVGRDVGEDPRAVGAAFRELAALDPEALRARAATTWQAQYRSALAQLEPID